MVVVKSNFFIYESLKLDLKYVKLELLDIVCFYFYLIRIYLVLNLIIGFLFIFNMLLFIFGFLVSIWGDLECFMFFEIVRVFEDNFYYGVEMYGIKYDGVFKKK